MIDYRELLKNYIREVEHMEGVTHIPSRPTLGPRQPGQTYFTFDDIAELHKLSVEPINGR